MQRLAVTRLVAASALISLPACSGSDAGSAAKTPDTVAVTSTSAHPDDGVLVIGAVLPRSGTATDLGASMTDALALGMQEINDAGGVNGAPVRLIIREEGDNPASARLAVQSLALRVDAIIGPTSSLNTLDTLGAAVDAGVLTCSPTASALALDNYPDDGLFFRTIPSDSLQATAIARLVEASGSSEAIVVYLDDDFGRPLAEATRAAIIAQGTRVVAAVSFAANDDSISAAVDEVLANRPEVIAVIADSTSGPAIINAIDAATETGPSFVVNDAIRRPAASAQPFPAGLAQRITGVSPMAVASSPSFGDALRAINPDSTGLYAHNAYDCLNIIALAAQAAGSDNPYEIAASISAVTASGSRCAEFSMCSAALAQGRNINYNGPTGQLSIGPDGNVVATGFDRFTFDANGRDVSDGTVTIGTD